MLNEYLSKIKEQTLTKEEAIEIDRYLYDNFDDMYTLDVKDVVYIIKLSKEFRLHHLLITLLYNSEIGCRYYLKEEDVDYFVYEHELQKALKEVDSMVSLNLPIKYRQMIRMTRKLN